MAMTRPPARNADPERRGHDHDGAAFAGPGTPTWTHTTEEPILARPAVGDRRVYTGTRTGRVLAVDRTDGRVVWERDLPAETVTAPVVLRSGAVFVAGFDDFGRAETTVHALDAGTGEDRWAAGTARGSRAPPVVAGNRVVVSHADDSLVVRRASDGTVAWDAAAASGDAAVARGTVFHATGDGVAAYGLSDGEPCWSRTLDGNSTTAPVAVDGLVLTGRRSGDLYALDAGTGEPRWTADLFRPAFHDDLRNLSRDGQGPPANRSAVSTLGVTADTAFVGTCNAVFALDVADGTVHWVRDLDCDYVHSSAAVGGRLHLGTADGSVYVLTYDGDVEYHLSPSNATTARATLADGALFVGGEALPEGPHSAPTSGFLSGYVDG
jgi:outer membrane protein assembly factor BamB